MVLDEWGRQNVECDFRVVLPGRPSDRPIARGIFSPNAN